MSEGIDLVVQSTQETTQPIANASDSLVNGFASSEGLVGPMILVILGLVAVMALSPYVGPYMAAVYEWLGSSLGYALKGLATVVLISAVSTPVYLAGQADAETRNTIALGAVAIVAAYIGLAAIGFVADRVWAAWSARHERITGNHPLDGVREAFAEDTEAEDA